MYLKRLLAFLCCFTLVFCLFPSSAFATGGNGNIDGGGGSMGHGTSSNFWNSGNDGVRITVVDASSGTAVSSPLDFSNRTQKTSLLHFGKVNKLQYLGGAGLSLQSGVAYSCIRPTQSMPTIVSSKGQSNIEAIKRYFCSEYACMMVAQAAGVDYLNGNLAIQMVTWESGDPEPWATLTVNLPGQRQKDHAFIDTNADSEFPTWLIRHGLAIPTGRTMQSGFCTYPEYRFRANRLQELDPEGYAGYLKNFERRCSA